MTQLLSPLHQALGNQPKSSDLEQFIKTESLISSIKRAFNDLIEAWFEAKSNLAKHYNKRGHFE
ncbi:hypothetical protein D521_2096 [beta proteobacterium CB]|nr:hypothetical protein D521_2096 [beta proteobacterium CB]